MSANLLTVRGSIQLECESFGDPAGEALLLISGAGAPARFWPDAFCRRLAGDRLHVLRYSHRDTGLSDHFDEPYPLDELLRDLLALLSVHEIDRAHLVGHSMGGYLAQMALVDHPERVLSVTSISAGSTVDPERMRRLGMSAPSEATWQRLMRNEPTGNFEADLESWLDVWRFLNGGRPFEEELATAYTRALYKGDPRNRQVARNHVHAMTTVPQDLVKALERIDLPLRVIHGSEDPLVPLDHGQATARQAAGATTHWLQGAGHMFFQAELWDEIAEALRAQVEPRS